MVLVCTSFFVLLNATCSSCSLNRDIVMPILSPLVLRIYPTFLRIICSCCYQNQQHFCNNLFSKFHVIIIYLEIRGLVKIQEILRVPAPRGIGFFINFSLATRVEITPLAIHGDFQRLRHLHNRYLINTIIKINPQKTEFLKSRNWYLLDLMRRFSDRMFFSHLFWNRWSYSGQ